MWTVTVGKDFTLGNFSFAPDKLTKNSDPHKYKYSSYGTKFDASGSFSQFDSSGFGKNVIIFVVNMTSSAHAENKKKDILTHGKGPTQGLNDTTLTAKTERSTNFTQKQKKFCLSLHYDGANICIMVFLMVLNI